MKRNSENRIIKQIDSISQNLRGSYDLDPLMHLIGNAKYILLGEGSYGTSEYYLWRARISQRLINEKGFSFIAVEGDWPDCYKLNRYIKGYNDSGTRAYEVLNGFNRWPSWMWANWEMAAFSEWLHDYNSQHQNKIGFYGLDMYSLWESMELIMSYLKKNEPDSVETAKRAYRCFEPYSENIESYAWTPRFVPDTCEEEVIYLLKEMQNKTEHYDSDPEAAFNAEQNTRVVVNAEKYYKSMLKGGADSWNIRDIHMTDALDAIMNHHGKNARGIIWAHNSHIGDARATNMPDAGYSNLGQLVRERHKEDGVILTGFSCYSGEVIAAKSWGDTIAKFRIPEASKYSWEEVFHRSGQTDRLLILRDVNDFEEFMERRTHRAIGVIYNPEDEQRSNYVPTVLPERYDAFIYLDNTQTLSPLHPEKDFGKPPETFPWGI